MSILNKPKVVEGFALKRAQLLAGTPEVKGLRGDVSLGYELCRNLRHDRVTRSAQRAHSVAYPMSQRLKAGFSWPGFAVCAGEPLQITERGRLDCWRFVD